MKILALADEPDRHLWDRFDKTTLKEVDLILSAGDLPAEYLSFLTVYTHAPILYVRGNHDTLYEQHPPEGCIDCDGTVIEYNGIRILGLGGSYRYKAGSCMYTEREMKKRICNLKMAIKLKKGFDILLTHAPARGIGDFDTLAHQGFECFKTLMSRYHPSFMVHGHVHKQYTSHFVREREYEGVKVINAYSKYVFEMPDKPDFSYKSKQL